MEFTELKKFIEDMTDEVSGLKATIEYLERFLMDESPLVPQDIAKLKAELAEASKALQTAIEYDARLMAY